MSLAIAGSNRLAGTAALSNVCAEGLQSLRNARRGGWQTAQEHLRILTNGRCRFFADSTDENSFYSGANLRLGRISLQYFHYDWPKECRTRTERSAGQDLALYIPLAGSFSAQQRMRTVEVQTGDILVVGSAGEIQRTWQGRSELINVGLPLETLNRLLVMEYGLDADQTIRFQPLTLMKAEQAPTLIKFVESIVRDAATGAPIFSDPLVAGPAQSTLLHILLRSLPHNHSDHVNGDRSAIAPYYVRRAESHLICHLADDVTIEDLAEVAGVSPRTIYYGFKQYRHMTPMKLLKRMRLNKARSDLLESSMGPRTVSEIASRYGYCNASQFSRDYKSLFGESPQLTLRRAGAC
ncbi:AraC family transcriptional regulator [Sinorhizobium mexicanum]|uniref:Helix-turn-helix domain-containing protein n=1 Tax=Sinorhizobium mexicanum TaxID=375549 RepID=A0A859QFH0_9HYPH|nr:AraC family transcriptional regulator [Sinorhizobium mexicanum]MBP1884363.1 AraC-like DNA-binding protein [Sinorhizobium mexicanum]QLL65043.1 helix-turn-helix domain-containing protein [Sinorhizobium mexicanum]